MRERTSLIRLAVEALAITAQFIPGEGWRVSVRSRRQGDAWDEGWGVQYDRLSTAEMVDVLDLELPRALGLGA